MIEKTKNMLRSTAMAFSMFSRVPMPRVEWKPENMRYALASFPLVGVLLGLILYGWAWLCALLSFGTVLSAAGIALLPVLFTGGIHLDGFCDTVDALSSHAAPEKKREILKDPHIGAFAAIGVGAYLVAYVALATELYLERPSAMLLFFIPALSRTVAGYAGAAAKSGGDGLLQAMRGAAPEKSAANALAVWFVLLAVAMLAISPLAGLFVLLCAASCGYLVFRMSNRQFGGMSGDIAGFLLQTSELVMLLALVLAQKGAGI